MEPSNFKVLIVLCFLCSGLSAQVNHGIVDSTQMKTLLIDPQTARGATVSQVFDEVAFIPLETTKESMFGRIDDLKISANHFIIYDQDTRSILIFSKTGKYISKINGAKLKSNDQYVIKNYDLIKDSDKELIVVYTLKNLYYFTPEGLLAKTIRNENPEHVMDTRSKDGKTTFRIKFRPDQRKKSDTIYEMATIRDVDTIAYFPHKTDWYDDFFAIPSAFYDCGVNNERLFVGQYNYDIYRVDPKKLSLAYKLVFPSANTLPVDFMTNPVYKGKRLQSIGKNGKKFFGLKNTYQIGNLLFFNILNFSTDIKTCLIYNLKSSELISVRNIEADSRSSYLPVTDAGDFLDYESDGFHLYNGGYLYTSYSSLAMFTFKKALGDKNKGFSPAMSTYFATQNEKSNPVIIQLKPKKD